MNFLSLGLKTLKKAEAAYNQAAADNKLLEEHGATFIPEFPDYVKARVIENEMKRMEEAFDIGMKYYQMAKEKLKNHGGRTYMLSIRPPHNIAFHQFHSDCLFFINKWNKKWDWYEFTWEQKGTDAETMGHGFHIHLLFETRENNYYPSHIIRDSASTFHYVANNCIQCDTIKDLQRAKEYIRGIKNDKDKDKCIQWDIEWRKINNLKDLYSNETSIEVKSNALLTF